MVLEAGKVWDQGASLVGFWWEPSSWLALGCLSLTANGSGVMGDLWSLSSYKGTNWIMGASPSWLHLNLITTCLRPHFQMPSHWELGLQRMNLGRHKPTAHNKPTHKETPVSCFLCLSKKLKTSSSLDFEPHLPYNLSAWQWTLKLFTFEQGAVVLHQPLGDPSITSQGSLANLKILQTRKHKANC